MPPDPTPLSVAVACAGRQEAKVEVPFAAVNEEKGIIDARIDGEVAWVVTAYDRGSTYGATTTLVAWKSADHWKLTKAPFSRGQVLVDGTFIDQQEEPRHYRFSAGGCGFPGVRGIPWRSWDHGDHA
jgi:hypothetical protein